MKDVVTYHIGHRHSEEMEKKFEIVSKLIKNVLITVEKILLIMVIW